MKDIYRIPVTLPNNPLKELNSYFIRGTDRDLLIDMGFRREECHAALEEGLAELGCEPEKLDILLTHLHADHSGLVNEFIRPGCRVSVSEIDRKYMIEILTGTIRTTLRNRMLAEGFPEDVLSFVDTQNPAFVNLFEHVDESFHGLQDGDEIAVGDYRLRTVLTPGHTPGNAMFWMEKQRVMFTGDHVLFDITPNITAWVGVEDSLGDYISSLEKSLEYDVELALPGHRKPGDYRGRIRALLAHHDRRVSQALNIINDQQGLTAYEIASRMTWKIRADNWESFPAVQKWFAVGECMSHLDYLLKRDRIVRVEERGIYRYFDAS